MAVRSSFPFLVGEMGALIRALDWATTPLGRLEEWPQPLKTLVGVMLGSNQPMFVVWGPRRTLVYNDAYAEVLANKHPALGQDLLEVWDEIRADLQPLVDRAYRGEPSHADDIELLMHRKGYAEKTHWAYSYTPVLDESGAVAGFFCPCHEITGQVFAERRQALLAELGKALSGLDDPRTVMRTAVTLLGRHLKANRVGYGEVQADDATVVLHSCFAAGVAPLEGSYRLDSFGPDVIARQRQGLTQWSDDLARDPGQDPAVWAAIETRAYASVPLVREGRLVASLYVNFREPHVWTPDEIGWIEQVAARTWGEVERARAEGRLRESEARLRFLSKLDEALRASGDAPAAMAAAAELLARRLGASRCAYADVDADGDRFVIRSDHAAPGVASSAGTYSLDLFGARAAADMRGGRTLVVRDVAGELTPAQGRDMFQAIGIDAIVCCPLVKEGRLVAMMAVHQDQPRDWPRDEIALVEAVVERCWAHVERVAAEARLRDSEEFNRRILQSSADCIKVLGLDGRLEFMSEGGMCTMEVEDFGVIEGSYWPDFWHGEEHAKVLAALEEARRGGTGRFQGFAATMKGTPRWWDVAVTPINGPDERPEKLLAISRDITDQKRAEERLQDLAQTLEQRVAERTAERDRVWRNSRDLLVVIGTDGIFRAVNPAWTRILGHRPEGVVGRSFHDFVWPEDAAMTQSGLDDAAAARDLTNFENRYTHEDGAPRWVSWHTSVEGELVYAYGRDITAEKERQAALEAAQDQLRQAQKMEAVGQLTGGIAHDFNNLLTVVTGNLDMARRSLGNGDEARTQRQIHNALKGAERAGSLTHRLLAFARRQSLAPKVFDANELVAGMAELLARTLGDNVEFRTELPEALWTVRADPHQLENALLNLAVNARDAMAGSDGVGGGGQLVIATRNVALDEGWAKAVGAEMGRYVEIAVTDTGPGMPPEILGRVFEPFFTTKEAGKGTGLGLAMVYGFMKQSGGAVRIESAPGQGTTVRLLVPTAEFAAVDRGIAPELAGAGPDRARETIRGLTVLVVEDQEEVADLASAILDDLGCKVLRAADGPSALHLLDGGSPPDTRVDLLFSDVVMPGGMSGFELARQAQLVEPGLKVLLTTGYAHAVRGPDESRYPILDKPYRRADLVAKVRQVLDGAVPPTGETGHPTAR